ncbi:MAG: acetyltransferase [Bacteroidota bacterium]|nr:acetyltransferase [Bacteroidota bacterium]
MKFNGKFTLSPKARIGKNVRIGDGAVIYDNVIIGDDSVIGNDCVIGEPLQDYYLKESYQNPETFIGKDSLIRSHSILYAGSKFGEGFSTGHRVTIRENTLMGEKCRVGTLSDIQGYSTFGDHCWLHSNVHIGQRSNIGNFVFIYPYVVLTNDPHPPSNICIGPNIGDYSQIAVSSVILPGIHIGQHVLVAAHSVVSRDVEDYALVGGNPAKKLKDVRELRSRETGEAHYPWPYRFDRGMPWEGIGFEEWESNKNE